MAVDVSVDMERDVITLYGVDYALELFHVAFLPVGTVVEIIARGDGVVTYKQLPPLAAAAPLRGAEPG